VDRLTRGPKTAPRRLRRLVSGPGPAGGPDAPRRTLLRDGLIVTVGGQVERGVGILTALVLRRWLDPAQLGVYTGLRLFLDNTNRTSLGIGLGAVQEIPLLRANGRDAEARHLADVAHTTNSLTCLAYALALVVWGLYGRHEGPMAREWALGALGVAALVILRRRESFTIAVLRSLGEFRLTTELDLFEAVISVVAMGCGVILAGFWGLLAAVGIVLAAKVLYLRVRHPLRLAWVWDAPAAWRLLKVGLPILANTTAFAAVSSFDRGLILGRLPDGERLAGLYTVAILGTNWSVDLAGRVVHVLYLDFQRVLGKSGDVAEVARRARRATEIQALGLSVLAAWAALLAPPLIGWALPKYVEGLPALRPLLPGMILLGLCWPARQMLIAVGRPYSLCAATLAGLAVLATAGIAGADRWGIVGVAGGASVGYAAIFLLTTAVAWIPDLGLRGWASGLSRIAGPLAWSALGTTLALRCPSLSWAMTLLVAWTAAPAWQAWKLKRA
jgi:O-antigen/teichoic acid export membrane protein